LAHQEGRFVACFHLNVSLVHSPKLTLVANDNNLIGVGFALAKSIYFGSFEFTADHFGNLSPSLEGNDLGTVFVGLVHYVLPSLHTILKESSNEGNTTLSAGGAQNSLTIDGATW
jgi:hypothetical protein